MKDLPPNIETLIADVATTVKVLLREAVRQGFESGYAVLQAEIRQSLKSELISPQESEVEPEKEVEPEPVDYATLDPLTPIQFKVFSLIVAAGGGYIPASEFIAKTGNGGAATAVYALVHKGYVRRRQLTGGRVAYDVAGYGAPRQIGYGEHPHQAQNRRPPPPPQKPVEAVEAPAAPLTAPEPPALAAAAPVQPEPEKKSYPPVSAIQRAPVTRQKPKPFQSSRSENLTGALLGADGNGGHHQVPSDGKISVTGYLIRRGHTAFASRDGWVIDGKARDKFEVLEIVNGHRAQADLPPAAMGDLE